MKSDIQNYQIAEGLSDEQMAALLAEKLGRNMSVQGYKIVKGRKDAPREWLEALSIAPQEPMPSPSGNGSSGTGGDAAPRDPGGSASTPPRLAAGVLPFEVQSAHMQIMTVYTIAGKGAAMAMNAPPVAEVWAQYAPQIATAYIDWAKENATVAKYIAMMTLGGPAGNLIMLHASMVVTTLIVANKVNADALVPPGMREPQETDTIGDAPQGDPEMDGFVPTDEEPTRAAKRAPSAKRR